MQGGGSHGAYEAGSLWGIYDGLKKNGTPEKMAYDSVSGVSAGAINAFAVSMFPKGQEEAMVEFLSEAWLNLTTPDVYINWPIPYVEVRWKSGVYND
jgi:predicted acylesterase/phospholipase RssA